MTFLKSVFLTAAGVLLSASLAQAAPTAAFSAKFGVCFACHGVDGHAILPTYPNLAGQNKDYLVQTLREFRDGTRPNPVMGPMAKPLSNSDIDQVAMYFAGLKATK
ncbi:c-type cytochrome [Thiomonas intermedia]|uniref:c-type cytochrome n=1 Tax=Thiomonas intermedia TaxID=926 RepID=UPI0009A50C55|nr:cytochrome c [Thiomonas intermedia]